MNVQHKGTSFHSFLCGETTNTSPEVSVKLPYSSSTNYKYPSPPPLPPLSLRSKPLHKSLPLLQIFLGFLDDWKEFQRLIHSCEDPESLHQLTKHLIIGCFQKYLRVVTIKYQCIVGCFRQYQCRQQNFIHSKEKMKDQLIKKKRKKKKKVAIKSRKPSSTEWAGIL